MLVSLVGLKKIVTADCMVYQNIHAQKLTIKFLYVGFIALLEEPRNLLKKKKSFIFYNVPLVQVESFGILDALTT